MWWLAGATASEGQQAGRSPPRCAVAAEAAPTGAGLPPPASAGLEEKRGGRRSGDRHSVSTAVTLARCLALAHGAHRTVQSLPPSPGDVRRARGELHGGRCAPGGRGLGSWVSTEETPLVDYQGACRGSLHGWLCPHPQNLCTLPVSQRRPYGCDSDLETRRLSWVIWWAQCHHKGPCKMEAGGQRERRPDGGDKRWE